MKIFRSEEPEKEKFKFPVYTPAQEAVIKLRSYTRESHVARDVESLLELKKANHKPCQLPLFHITKQAPLVTASQHPSRKCPDCGSPAPYEYVTELNEYYCTNCGVKRREGEKRH